MIKALELIAKNPDKYEKLDETKKEIFISMAAKFCIHINLRVDLDYSRVDNKEIEEIYDPNNFVEEKFSLDEDSKVIGSKYKTAIPKQNEKEILIEESVSLGYREPNEINNLQSNLSENNTLSIIKEEKEVLSNSFKNNCSEELVYSSNNEKKIHEQNINRYINSFLNSKTEINNGYVNLSNNNPSNNPDLFTNQGKQVNNGNNKINSRENTPKEKAEAIIPANRNKKRLTIVDSKSQDDVDEKLDNYLINTYNKKKMSFIPMRRVSENNYEFGSQRIEIKIDDEIIRGIYLNSFHLSSYFAFVFLIM